MLVKRQTNLFLTMRRIATVYISPLWKKSGSFVKFTQISGMILA